MSEENQPPVPRDTEGKSDQSRRALVAGHYPPHHRGYYHMPFKEMRTHGLLWYINRVAFHPRGLSLTLTKDSEGEIIGWGIVGDGSEPWTFEPKDDDEEFGKFNEFLTDYLKGVRPEGEW